MPPQQTTPTLEELEGMKAQLAGAHTSLNRIKQPQPSISADDLAKPAVMPTPPAPQPPSIPQRVGATVNNVLGSIRSQSETARKLEEERAAFGDFAQNASGFEIQNQQLERFGVTPQKLKELEDIQLQLADMDTSSALTKTRIAGAEGQTLAQAQRELTQEDRENAVRSSGLAARAAVLQGNIETGRALANDAVNIALQDRSFKANAMLEQISYYQSIVDDETAQLLEGEKRQYEAELSRIEELKENVTNAIMAGASQSEIAQLNNPNLPDDQKLALAQQIQAREARTDINLNRAAKSASIASSNLSRRMNLLELAAMGDPEAIAQLGYDPNALPAKSLEDIAAFEAETSEIGNTIDVIEGILSNERGLKSATGAVQSPLLGGFFSGGTAEGAGKLTRFIPAVGNVQGAIQTKNATQDLLSDVTFIVNSQGFQEFINFKESGLTFGSLTEGERNAIFSAANELNSSIIPDANGRVTSINASYKKTVENLNKVLQGMQARQEELTAQFVLDPEEQQEIINTP